MSGTLHSMMPFNDVVSTIWMLKLSGNAGSHMGLHCIEPLTYKQFTAQSAKIPREINLLHNNNKA